ncbi:c-type cytochrome [Bosea sp. (in: a-proteobacteria)]|uniref:c-type cytochrome n=1 Tax=Bosea sp. (in: a-proteobacteria) TaxID=1871050 RepID=UPI002FCBFDB0
MPNAFPAPAWFGSVAAAIALSTGPASAAGDKALGEYLASECTTCHQTSGRQVGGIPAIIGHPADQFVALMIAYRDKQRDNQVMQTIAGRLTEEELQALAAYYESLKPSP